MNRHRIRWQGLVFGLVFLSVAGSWAVWRQDLLTRQQFSFALSGVLIVLGALGVIATFWRPRSRGTDHTAAFATDPSTAPPSPPEEHHEVSDPKP